MFWMLSLWHHWFPSIEPSFYIINLYTFYWCKFQGYSQPLYSFWNLALWSLRKCQFLLICCKFYFHTTLLVVVAKELWIELWKSIVVLIYQNSLVNAARFLKRPSPNPRRSSKNNEIKCIYEMNYYNWVSSKVRTRFSRERLLKNMVTNSFLWKFTFYFF